MLTQPTSDRATPAPQRWVETVRDGSRSRDPMTVPGDLEDLARTLRAAGDAQQELARRLVPSAETLDQGVCDRYRRAAAQWPVDPPPTNEQLATAMGRLQEAATAARVAARRSDQALSAVSDLLPAGRRG
jgi:hypothetical protein